MSQATFKAWDEQAAAERDAAIEQLKTTADAAPRALITLMPKEDLNRRE